MGFPFLNRTEEIKELDRLVKNHAKLLVIFGPRRIGKTRLIKEWLQTKGGVYTQAIQGPMTLQISQMMQDLSELFGNISILPKNWVEFFELLALVRKPFLLCIDEFPYLVETSPEIGSILQRFLDHKITKNSCMLLTGSSQTMMKEMMFAPTSPLLGRADRTFRIEPMSYQWFCKSLQMDPKDKESFCSFSLVGGIPRYWELIQLEGVRQSTEVADRMFFVPSSHLENAPFQLLQDEKINDIIPRTILETIGRGAERLSEIATKIQTPSTHLTRPLKTLVESGFVKKDHPFGESERNSKKSLYKISDPMLRFWFRTFSPHRSRWNRYTELQRKKLIDDHGGGVLEDLVRTHFQAERYWEKNIEFDLVRKEADDKKLIISEVKFARLSKKDKATIQADIGAKFESSALSRQYTLSHCEVIDVEDALELLLS